MRQSVNAVIKDIAISAGGLGFNSQVSEIVHRVTNISPLPRNFFGVVLSKRESPQMGPATCSRFMKLHYRTGRT